MDNNDKRSSERFVSFAHVRIIDAEMYGYITNISSTGIKTLLTAKVFTLKQEAQYNLELYAPELNLPRLSCIGLLKWMNVIDINHYEAGFEILSFSNDTAKLLFDRLIETYKRFD